MSTMGEINQRIMELEHELEETKKALNQALSREARLRDKVKELEAEIEGLEYDLKESGECY